MQRFIAVLLLVIAFDVSGARADDEASPIPYVTASSWGRYYFKMLPDPKHPFDRDKGNGIAYEVVEGDAGDKEIWRTKGWYASRTAIAGGGRYLVRIGNWPRGRKPSGKHLGIAFYDNGKLIRSYSTKQLLRGLPAPPASVSHYQFIEKVVGFDENSELEFTIRLVGGRTCTFDVRTGKYVKKAKKRKP